MHISISLDFYTSNAFRSTPDNSGFSAEGNLIHRGIAGKDGDDYQSHDFPGKNVIPVGPLRSEFLLPSL